MTIKEGPQPYIDPFASETALEVLDPQLSPLEWSSDTRLNVSGTLEVFSRGVKSGLFPRIRTEIGNPDSISLVENSDGQGPSMVDLKQGRENPYQDFILAVYTILSIHINTDQSPI